MLRRVIRSLVSMMISASRQMTSAGSSAGSRLLWGTISQLSPLSTPSVGSRGGQLLPHGSPRGNLVAIAALGVSANYNSVFASRQQWSCGDTRAKEPYFTIQYPTPQLYKLPTFFRSSRGDTTCHPGIWTSSRYFISVVSILRLPFWAPRTSHPQALFSHSSKF